MEPPIATDSPITTNFALPFSIPPTDTNHTHTVVFLHGRGDTPRSFASSLHSSPDAEGRSLVEAFPSLKWVFPEPGTQMNQWFDIWNVRDFTEREHVQAPGLRASVYGIRGIIEQEAAELGGRCDRIVLAGFSQGSATAVHTLLNLDVPSMPAADDALPRRLAAFLSFSARMPFSGRNLAGTRAILRLDDVPTDADVLCNTPMLLEHCADDPLVLVRHGRILRDTLKGFGANVAWREYPDGGHWFNSPKGMEEAAAFLEKVLGIQRAAAASSDAESSEAAPSEAASSEAASSEAASSEAASSEAASSGAASPKAASSEARSPEATSPEAASPKAASSEAASPEATSPESATMKGSPDALDLD
ncbi:Alpha/Beta hydrolase protein [Ilyonectria robusta]|uniref:Alpha/Beta hydrolase protein n=1 Tax=Ilyonectria robusta TaxID=1079257 RepID=UPI001E8CA018|nr:Alpha/Beta hydrolase protein [Ilyonectria robusta]KAH8679173.1 Alpha/Beta hydrolase protein [Ilyonectria robusta]